MVDGQLVTREERSLVDSLLAADNPSQEGMVLLDGAAAPTLEPQRTIKINHLSFNDHGESALHCWLNLNNNAGRHGSS